MEMVRLAIGAFLTSPGFGGLMALVAAVVAFRGVQARLNGDRLIAAESRSHEARLARQADQRARWWDMFFWLDRSFASLRTGEILTCLETLAEEAQTRTQAAAVDALMARMEGDLSDGRQAD